MRLTILRVVGNELPPRDAPGSKLAALKWLVQTDTSPDVQYVYLLNRIFDPAYLAQVYEVLQGQEIIEFPFDIEKYRKIPATPESRIWYAVGINEARNFGIRYCQAQSDFVACLDQECFIPRDELPRVIEFIERDQGVYSHVRRHYGLVSKRCHIAAIPEDYHTVDDAEPMVIVREDTTELFDAALMFGRRDKLALLEWMGYTVDKRGVRHRGERAKTAGICVHMAFGDPAIEEDIHLRGDLRALSLQRLLDRIDQVYAKRR